MPGISQQRRASKQEQEQIQEQERKQSLSTEEPQMEEVNQSQNAPQTFAEGNLRFLFTSFP